MEKMPVDRNTIALWVHLFDSWQQILWRMSLVFLGGRVDLLCREISVCILIITVALCSEVLVYLCQIVHWVWGFCKVYFCMQYWTP